MTTARAIRPRPTRRRALASSDLVRPKATVLATSAAPTSASTPSAAPSATRSERVATSSVSAGRVNAQAPTRSAGPHDATSTSPVCTRLADQEPQRDHADRDDGAGARECQQQRERRHVHEERAEHADDTAMRALGCEPESEHDRTVGQQCECVPVADRLAKPCNAVAFGIERGNSLRDQRVHHGRADDDRERRSREPSPEPTPEGGEHDAESEERAVRDGLVERVPTSIPDDRPAHRRADPQRERHGRADEKHPERPMRGTGSHPAAAATSAAASAITAAPPTGSVPDIGPVAGEQRADQDRSDEPCEGHCREAGCPDGGLRPRFHGEPR